MNLRHLADFFRGLTSAEVISSEITSAVEEFRKDSSKKGSSLPVYASEDNFHFVLGRADVKKLCDMYLRGVFSEWHIQYICTLIELASSFSTNDEKVEEAIFQMAEPEINRPLSPATVTQICEGL